MRFSFYHITDLHYFSKKNFDAPPEKTPRYNDQLTIKESEELLKEALRLAENDRDTDSVFITGDITNRGDIDSLKESCSLLEAYSDKLNICAFLDTHDYFSDASVTRISSDGKPYSVPPDKLEEKTKLRAAFNKFGIDKAKYAYSDGFTCFIEVAPGVYYIQLRNYENEKRARVFDGDMLDWVTQTAEKLRDDGAFLFAGVHIPVLAPSPVYVVLGNGSVPVNGREVAGRFADAGIGLIISGHSHIHSIRYVLSEKGNVCYEVGTGSLGGYPGKIRKISIDTEKNTIKVKSISVNPPSLEAGKSMAEIGKEAFTASLSPVFYNMEHDVEALLSTGGGIKFPEKAMRRHKKLVMKLGRGINNLTFGRVGDLVRFETGLKKFEYDEIRDKKLVPALIEAITGLYGGEEGYKPFSPEYKVLMSVVSALDSIIRLLPLDFEKIIGYPNLYSVAEPLIYRGENDNAELSLEKTPEDATTPYHYVSHTGAKLAAAAAVPAVTAAAAGIIKLLKGKKKK